MNGIDASRRARREMFERCRSTGLLAILLLLAGIGVSTAAPVYTDHPRQGGRTRPVPVFIDASFTGVEKDQIRSALDEWNQVLNGAARFLVVPAAGDQTEGVKAWVIRKGAGRDGVREPGRKDQNLGTAQPLPMGGGVLIIFSGAGSYMADHGLSLRDVMMRELGHVLGLRHAEHGDLLAADYRSGDASCVDRAVTDQIAKVLQVPEESLNWCELPK